MKCFASGSIWNGWLGVWTHGKNLKSTINLDVYFLQEAFFSEYIFHTLPQLGFLSYNLSREGGIHASPVGLISFGITCIMFIYGSYRIWILYFCLKKDFYRVPFGPAWLVDSVYIEEELAREEQEEHMVGHEARLAARNVFMQSNPMHSAQQRQKRADKRKKTLHDANAMILSSEPQNVWDVILKSKLLLEQKSEFRELNKLETILRELSATDSEGVCKLNPHEINCISTLIPDELVHHFDSLIPPLEIRDDDNKTDGDGMKPTGHVDDGGGGYDGDIELHEIESAALLEGDTQSYQESGHNYHLQKEQVVDIYEGSDVSDDDDDDDCNNGMGHESGKTSNIV